MFEVGDIIRHKNQELRQIRQIKAINNETYTLIREDKSTVHLTKFYIHNRYRLITPQDKLELL